jgi:nicotinate phosphoribosyltransferase
MKEKQIYTSVLDTDFYKFSMGQMIFKYHPRVPVEFRFINRSKSVRLAEGIDMGELREQLDAARRVETTDKDLRVLMGTSYDYNRLSMFHFDYLAFLKNLRLPEYSLEKTSDGQLDLRFYGNWAETTYCEIPGMYIPKELYRKAILKSMTIGERNRLMQEGRERLYTKIALLSKYRHVTFSELSTRRRFSYEHQDFVVEKLAKNFKPEQFKGSSNVLLANKHGVAAMGTTGHELSMAYSGIHYDQDEIDPTFSSRQVLKDWEEMYGLDLSIFLPDTWGSDWFFDKVVTPDQLRRWKGSRNDSQDPYVYSRKMIPRYHGVDVDPMTKFVLDADNQTAISIVEIGNTFRYEMPHTFGIGTHFGDDFGLPNLPIVVKMVSAAGHPVCKLSDNLDKASGDPAAIERMKRLCGYDNTYSKACVS